MYVCMYVHCMYVCMYMCMYVCMYMCMHVCMYVRTYIHTCFIYTTSHLNRTNNLSEAKTIFDDMENRGFKIQHLLYHTKLTNKQMTKLVQVTRNLYVMWGSLI